MLSETLPHIEYADLPFPSGQDVLQQIERATKKREKKANLTVTTYNFAVKEFNERMPHLAQPTIESWGAAIKKKDDDDFWVDIIFQTQSDADWATSEPCRKGMSLSENICDSTD